MDKVVNFVKLASPICFHSWTREGFGITRKCSKCNKVMLGNLTVRHGDWIINLNRKH